MTQRAMFVAEVFWVSECPEVVAAQAAAAAAEQANVDAWLAAQAANAAQAESARLAAARSAAAAAPAQLPRTGSLTGLLTAIAMSMIVAGALLARLGRRETVTGRNPIGQVDLS